MSAIPEHAITFTTLLVGLLTTGVLVLLPSTWQGDGRAVRYWVIGNLALSLERLHTLMPGVLGPDVLPAALMPLAAACTLLGAGMHVTAIRMLVRPEQRRIDWRWPASGALALAMLGLALGSQRAILLGLSSTTSVCVVLMLRLCWPERRQLRGALVMSGAMCFFLLMNAGGIWELAHLPPPAPGAEAVSTPIAILALDLVLSVVVNLAFLLILIELLHQRVERLSVTDPLTGALNRRGFLQAANLQLLHSDRLGIRPRSASVLLLDLDHFKRINDSLGHPMGDAVLSGAVERAASAVRQSDVIARWGGEEFVVLLPGSPLSQAREVAERIRLAIGSTPLADGAPIVTVSIGAAALDELLAVDQLPALIGEADRRLYLAKRRRDCVVAHDVQDEPSDRAAAESAGAAAAARPASAANPAQALTAAS